jgi:hypothetical protein
VQTETFSNIWSRKQVYFRLQLRKLLSKSIQTLHKVILVASTGRESDLNPGNCETTAQAATSATRTEETTPSPEVASEATNYTSVPELETKAS